MKSEEVSGHLKTTLRHLRLATKNVLGTEGSRSNIQNHLNAFRHLFGTPLVFTTTNLSERNPVLKLLLEGPSADYVFEVEAPEMPRFDRLRQQMLKNPPAMAQFFTVMMTMFETHVLGWKRTSRSYYNVVHSQRGMVGLVMAYYGVTEEQARGWLHTHWLVWLHADQLRDLLQRCEADGTIDSVKAMIKNWVVATVQCCERMELAGIGDFPAHLRVGDPTPAD
jgi:hypothetical protein